MSIYAVSDLHGKLEIYKRIKEFLKPEDTLVVLGDCGDRGPDGWEIIKDVYINSIGEDSQMIYIKGNHEDMLVNALEEYLDNCYGSETSLLFHNGGYETFNALISTTAEENIKEWYWRLKNLSTSFMLPVGGKKVCLTHAGGTSTTIKELTEEEKNEYFIWNRIGIEEDEPNDNYLWVHGHTPVFYFPQAGRDVKENPKAKWYSNNRKVCIDMGTFITGISCVLDLDTLEEHYFDETGEIDINGEI
jgi:serine/threonine protein phosphatase 1